MQVTIRHSLSGAMRTIDVIGTKEVPGTVSVKWGPMVGVHYLSLKTGRLVSRSSKIFEWRVVDDDLEKLRERFGKEVKNGIA